MSGSSFNITDRKPDIESNLMLVVRTTADLPAEGTGPNEGFRDFDMDQGLYIKNNITDDLVWRWPDESEIYIEALYPAGNQITYTGTANFLQCAGQSKVVTIRTVNFFTFAGNSAAALDITASLTTLGAGFGIFNCQFFNFGGGIRYKNYANGVIDGIVSFGMEKGVVFENCGVYELNTMLMIGSGAGNQALLTIVGEGTLQGRIHDTDFNAFLGNSGIHFGQNLNPFAALSAISVNQTNGGITGGSFFKPLLGASITAASDQTTSGTGATVSSLASPIGPVALFTDTAHGLVVDDVVVLSSFTEYPNSTFIVHKADANTFQLGTLTPLSPLLFTLTDTGDWTKNLVRLATTDTSNLRVGQGVNIVKTGGTEDYSGNFTVKNIILNTSFDVPATFTDVSFAGDFTVGSLTEADPEIFIDNAGAQKASKTIALGALNAFTTATPIANADEYFPMLVTGFTSNIVLERFELEDAGSGRFIYVGQNPFQGFVSGVVTIDSSGNNTYRLSMSFNEGKPLFSAITSEAIASVALGNAGRARFTHALTSPELPLGATVTLSGFVNNPLYNQKDIVVFTNGGANTQFEVDGILFGSNEVTGSFVGERANYVIADVKSSLVTIPLLFMAKLQPNDRIQIMIAGQSTSSNPDITDFTFGVF